MDELSLRCHPVKFPAVTRNVKEYVWKLHIAIPKYPPPPPPDYSILSFLRHIIITLSDEIERTLTNEACISAGPSQQHSGSLWIFENPPRVTRIFGGS